MSRSTFTLRLLGATAAVLLASACGSTTATPGVAASPTSASTGGVLGVRTTSLGPVLVDAQGITVYLLTADKPGHSSCSTACLQYWPPVPAPDGSAVYTVQGISAPLAETRASNGAAMVTASGWPLYTFLKDKAPGDVKGQGVKTFDGTWYAVSPSGMAVTTPAAGAPSPSGSTSTSGGVRGGYGY